MQKTEELREQREKEERVAKVAAIADAERRRTETRTDAEVVDDIFGSIVDSAQQGAAPDGFEVRAFEMILKSEI